MAFLYSRERLTEAVAESTTLREVAVKLGARPAGGTLSHLRRRIAEAGIDVSHFPGLNRKRVEFPFTREELAAAAAASTSVRAVARLLGVPDDGRVREALRRTLEQHGIDLAHFAHRRMRICDSALTKAVASSRSYADVMRHLGLPVDDVHHRRVQRQAGRLGLDTGHFIRRPRRAAPAPTPRRPAGEVLRRLPEGAPRMNRERLKRALDEVGVPYRCDDCGNEGEWRGVVMTLQIDHVDGDWRNNRRENLRYLCPNCHAITSTWCRKKRGPQQDRR